MKKRRRRTKRGRKPARSRFSHQRIADLPPEASAVEICRILGISYPTFLRWVRLGAPVTVEQGKRTRHYIIESENFIGWLVETKRYTPRPY